jgi:hypothetical protein
VAAALQLLPLGQGNVFPFGIRVANSITTFSISITNNGNTPLLFAATAAVISPITANAGDFSLASSLNGQTVLPGATVFLAIQFKPTMAASTQESATLQFFSNSTSGPTIITLTGTSASTSQVFFTVQSQLSNGAATAAVINFGNVIAGQVLLSPTITYGNPTSGNVGQTSTALSANGYSIVDVVGGEPIGPGGTVTFKLQLIPLAEMPSQDDLNAVSAAVAGGTFTPQLIEAQYNTIAFTPVNNLTDLNEEMWLAALDATGDVTLMFADDTSLFCEEDASFTFTWDMKMPDVEKQLARFLLRYEALGPAQVTITFTGDLQNQNQVSTERTLSTNSGGGLLNALFDASIAGSTIVVEVLVAGSTGPLSVALYIGYFEPRGEIVENT